MIRRRNRATAVVGEFTELVSDTGGGAVACTDGSVESEASYTCRVRAINGHGMSERSRGAVATAAVRRERSGIEGSSG